MTFALKCDIIIRNTAETPGATGGREKRGKELTMTQWKVRAADADFVECETFDNPNEALAYADRMGEIFGSWNVELWRVKKEVAHQ